MTSQRSKRLFLLLIVVQAAHSSEEYATKLYEALAPAGFISGLFSDNHSVGFLVFNGAVVAAGLLCYLTLVRGGRSFAVPVAWFWTVVELANGLGHIALAIASRGYFPGLATGVALLVAASYLAVSLEADRRRNA